MLRRPCCDVMAGPCLINGRKGRDLEYKSGYRSLIPRDVLYKRLKAHSSLSPKHSLARPYQEYFISPIVFHAPFTPQCQTNLSSSSQSCTRERSTARLSSHTLGISKRPCGKPRLTPRRHYLVLHRAYQASSRQRSDFVPCHCVRFATANTIQ